MGEGGASASSCTSITRIASLDIFPFCFPIFISNIVRIVGMDRGHYTLVVLVRTVVPRLDPCIYTQLIVRRRRRRRRRLGGRRRRCRHRGFGSLSSRKSGDLRLLDEFGRQGRDLHGPL